MTSDAQWLLKRQPFLKAREKLLLQWIKTVDMSAPGDEEIIEGILFSHKGGEKVQTSTAQSSKTEFAAIHMDELRMCRIDENERRREQWNKELMLIQNWLAMLDAALLALTPEENMLVKLYYCDGKSIDTLAQSPLLDVTRSRSTLKRMLKKIIQKVEEVISIEEGNFILPRI